MDFSLHLCPSALHLAEITFSNPRLTAIGKSPMVSSVDILPSDQGQPEHRIDGGITAWLQVFGSWILFLNSWFVQEALVSTVHVSEIYNLMKFLGASLIFLELSRLIIPQPSYLILVPRASPGLAPRNSFYLCSLVCSLDDFSTQGMSAWFSLSARFSRCSEQ